MQIPLLLALTLGVCCHAQSTAGSVTVKATTTSLNPSPTESVRCFPTHGNTPEDMILRQVNPNITSWCQDPNLAFVDTTDPSAPKGYNYLTGGWTLAPSAPAECSALPSKGSSSSRASRLCEEPLAAIVAACPWNGGSVSNVCGEFWFQTCPVGRLCAIGNASGSP